MVFRELAPTLDLMIMSLENPREPPRPLIKTPFGEPNAEISPDGRWVAYQSNESGRFEIYVRPFPNVDAGRWLVSTDGGIQPLWSKNGQELFYVGSNGALMSVSVVSEKSW